MLMAGFARRLLGGALVLAVSAAPALAQLTESPRYSSIVTEARTGNVLSATNADEIRHPASLTKMMTLYMLFEAMRAGRVELSTPIRVSYEAASRPPSKLGVPAGGTVSTETAILALVTRSANDIAAAVGEHLGGDEESFARMMTMRARSLGMTRTTFRNASGLPDPEQVTTARDMALLGRRLFLDFPDRYSYFAVTHFAHGQRMIRNHNGMLHDYPGADGIKTGFINASGFNIVTSAQRDGVRLVGAVFGGNSWHQRNSHMAELLDEGFERMGVRRPPVVMAQAPRQAAPVLAARPAPAPTLVPYAANRRAPQPQLARVQPPARPQLAAARGFQPQPQRAAARPAAAPQPSPRAATARPVPQLARPATARPVPQPQRPATRTTEAPRPALLQLARATR